MSHSIVVTIPEPDQVEYLVGIDPEDSPVPTGGAWSDEFRADVLRRLEDDGDTWAWCAAMVTARWRGMYGCAYLGGCSYLSEEDFKQHGPWEDMKARAYAEMVAWIKRLAE